MVTLCNATDVITSSRLAVGGNEERKMEAGMEEGREVIEEWMCVSKVARLLLWKDVGTGQTTHTYTQTETHTRTLVARSRQASALVIVMHW